MWGSQNRQSWLHRQRLNWLWLLTLQPRQTAAVCQSCTRNRGTSSVSPQDLPTELPGNTLVIIIVIIVIITAYIVRAKTATPTAASLLHTSCTVLSRHRPSFAARLLHSHELHSALTTSTQFHCLLVCFARAALCSHDIDPVSLLACFIHTSCTLLSQNKWTKHSINDDSEWCNWIDTFRPFWFWSHIQSFLPVWHFHKFSYYQICFQLLFDWWNQHGKAASVIVDVDERERDRQQTQQTVLHIRTSFLSVCLSVCPAKQFTWPIYTHFTNSTLHVRVCLVITSRLRPVCLVAWTHASSRGPVPVLATRVSPLPAPGSGTAWNCDGQKPSLANSAAAAAAVRQSSMYCIETKERLKWHTSLLPTSSSSVTSVRLNDGYLDAVS